MKKWRTPTVGAGVGFSPWELPPLSIWQLDGQAILRWQGSLTRLLPYIPIADALTNRQTKTDKDRQRQKKIDKDRHFKHFMVFFIGEEIHRPASQKNWHHNFDSQKALGHTFHHQQHHHDQGGKVLLPAGWSRKPQPSAAAPACLSG